MAVLFRTEREGIVCKYCEEHVLERNLADPSEYGTEALCLREESKNNYGYYTGIEVRIEGNKLAMFAVVDGKNIKCICEEKRIKINFCPMCGRKLEGDKATTEQ